MPPVITLTVPLFVRFPLMLICWLAFTVNDAPLLIVRFRHKAVGSAVGDALTIGWYEIPLGITTSVSIVGTTPPHQLFPSFQFPGNVPPIQPVPGIIVITFAVDNPEHVPTVALRR